MTFIPFILAVVIGSIEASLIGRLIGSACERLVDPDDRESARYFFGSYLMLIDGIAGAIAAGIAWSLAGFWTAMGWAIGVAVVWPLIIWGHQVLGEAVEDAGRGLQEKIYRSPAVACAFLLKQLLNLKALIKRGRLSTRRP